MRATLFGVPGSHPTALAGELMLERKGIEVRRLDLVAGVHRVMVRGLGFPRVTVPAVVVDGVSASRARARSPSRWTPWCPRPPLVPADAGASRGGAAPPRAGRTRCSSRWRGGSPGRRSGATARRSRPTSRTRISASPPHVAAAHRAAGDPARGAAQPRRATTPCGATSARAAGAARPGGRAAGRGRDRRRGAERGRFPDRHERPAADVARGPARPGSSAGRPARTPSRWCRASRAGCGPVFPPEWLPAAAA